MSNTTTPGKVEQQRAMREDKVQRAAADAAALAMENGDTDDQVQRAAAQAAEIEREAQHDPTPKDVQQDVEQVTQPGSILQPVDGAKVIEMVKAAAPKRAPNRKARNAANAEALAGAKKVADALDPPAKKAPAKKAPAKKTAPAAKAAPAKAAPAKVLPKAAKLTWETKGDDADVQQANGARHQYRVREGSSGGFFATQRLAKGGKWVHVAGKCDTADQAKELAGMVEAGATWLSYQTMVNVPYAKVIENFGKASK